MNTGLDQHWWNPAPTRWHPKHSSLPRPHVPFFRKYFARKQKASSALRRAIKSKAGQQALQAFNLKIIQWYQRGGKKHLLKKLIMLKNLGVKRVGKQLQKYERQLLVTAFKVGEEDSDLVQTGYLFFLIPSLIKRVVVTMVKKLIFVVKAKAGKVIKLGKKWATKQAKKCLTSCAKSKLNVSFFEKKKQVLSQEAATKKMMLTQATGKTGWWRRRRRAKPKTKQKIVSKHCLNRCRPLNVPKFGRRAKKRTMERHQKRRRKRIAHERRAKYHHRKKRIARVRRKMERHQKMRRKHIARERRAKYHHRKKRIARVRRKMERHQKMRRKHIARERGAKSWYKKHQANRARKRARKRERARKHSWRKGFKERRIKYSLRMKRHAKA